MSTNAATAPDLDGRVEPETTIGGYLIDRLQALGVEHVFGIPGDYILTLYKMLEESPIQLVGMTREDNAGFAADAYARVHGLGCVCVTYCVGGLSAVQQHRRGLRREVAGDRHLAARRASASASATRCSTTRSATSRRRPRSSRRSPSPRRSSTTRSTAFAEIDRVLAAARPLQAAGLPGNPPRHGPGPPDGPAPAPRRPAAERPRRPPRGASTRPSACSTKAEAADDPGRRRGPPLRPPGRR